jgi:hypothetical protein
MKLFFFFWLPIIVAISLWMYVENKHQASPDGQAELQQQYVDRLGERVEYMKDLSTGICFAYMDSAGPHGLGFATVDCGQLQTVPVTEFTSPTK